MPLDGSIVADLTLAYVLNDSQAVLTLAMRDYTHRVSGGSVMCLEDLLAECDNDTTWDIPSDLSSPTDSAYIIYTSGMHLLICVIFLR